VIYCIYCGAKLPKDAVFCSTCGKNINFKITEPQERKSGIDSESEKIIELNEDVLVESSANRGKKICADCLQPNGLFTPKCSSCNGTTFNFPRRSTEDGRENLEILASRNTYQSPTSSQETFFGRNKFAIFTFCAILILIIFVASRSSTDSGFTSTTNSSSSSDGSSQSTDDLLSRLNSAGVSTWSQDVFVQPNPSPGFILDYLGDDVVDSGGCNISVYESENQAADAVNSGLNIDLGVTWHGADYLTGQGIALTAFGENNSCVTAAFYALNWSKG
jgi:ribosomal protein L40E